MKTSLLQDKSQVTKRNTQVSLPDNPFLTNQQNTNPFVSQQHITQNPFQATHGIQCKEQKTESKEDEEKQNLPETADSAHSATDAEDNTIQRKIGVAPTLPFLIQRDESPASAPATDSAHPATAPPVPGFEAITGTTQAQNSFGDLGDSIANLWHREHLSFTDAARAVADRPAAHGMPYATQSQATPATTYHTRQALVMVAWDYRTWGDVPQIRRYLREGSRFQNALSGEFAHINNVENPTGANIEANIHTMVQAIATALPAGAIGELLVYYTGHGGGAGISGVDEISVGADRLQAIATAAQAQRVHITYIFDSCNIGAIVNLAQQDTLATVRPLISQAPEARRAEFTAQLDILNDISQLTDAIGADVTDLYGLRRQWGNTAAQETGRGLCENISNAFRNISERMRGFNLTTSIDRLGLLMSFLVPEIEMALKSEGQLSPGNPNRITVAWVNEQRRLIAPILDNLNDVIRQGTADLQRQIQEASTPATPAPTTTPASAS
jgi:hypothetical protein